MTYAFLENCGQYLYNCKESRLRTLAALKNIMRLKAAQVLDPRHVAQVENCYILVKPPDDIGVQVKQQLQMHTYIRHLIFEELNKTNVNLMINLMLKLDYTDLKLADCILQICYQV